MSNTGIPVNNALIFDSVMFKGEDCVIVDGDNYLNGRAVRSNSPLVNLLDTNNLPVGTLAGPQVLTVLWNCTTTTEYAINIQIIRDSSLEYYVGFQFEDDDTYKGTVIIHQFKPNSSYRIKISSLTSNTTILDYVKFTPVFPGSLVHGTREVHGGEECLTVTDKGNGTVTGDNTTYKDVAVYYNVPFVEPPDVFFQSGHHQLHCVSVLEYSWGCVMRMYHVLGQNWSSNQSFRWLAVGSVATPFAPGIPK